MEEREIKLRVEDARAIRRRLEEQGYRESKPRRKEVNVVYDTPDQRLRRESKLLRVREVGGAGVLTVKLPSADSKPHKTREELEIESREPETLRRILDGLGFEPAWRYEKFRAEYSKNGEPGVVEVDETPIGDLIELEGEADWIDRTAEALGFSPEDYETATYGELFEKWRTATGSSKRDMVFD